MMYKVYDVISEGDGEIRYIMSGAWSAKKEDSDRLVARFKRERGEWVMSLCYAKGTLTLSEAMKVVSLLQELNGVSQ